MEMRRQENIHNDKGKDLSNLKENLTKVLSEMGWGVALLGNTFLASRKPWFHPQHQHHVK